MSGYYSILECYNLVSGVKLSIRSPCFNCWNSQHLLDSSYINLLVLMGVEVPLCLAVTLSWSCYNLFSGVNLSIRLSCFICWNSQCLLDSSIILLILMVVELIWCLAVTLSWNALTCFLKSS